ncbi:MAG: TVP38/TMEM64 family protein [Haloarculaceae archaeon]
MRSSVRVFADKRGRRSALLALLIVVAVFVALSLLLRRNFAWLSNPAAVRAWIRSFGLLGPLVFFFLQALQVVVAPIPGQVMGFASGYLFGAVWGTIITVTGAVLGSYVAFRLSRHFGRPFVERVIHTDTLDQFDSLTHEHGLLTLFLVFLIPGLPDDVICFTAGLTDLRIDRMVFVSFVGRIPAFFVANLAGASVAEGRLWQTVVIVGILVLATSVAYLWRGRIVAYLDSDEPESE